MNEWQPIATAPENEWVLCFAPDWNYPHVLMLSKVYGRTIQHPDNVSGDGLGREAAKEWGDDSGDGGQDWRPTHWMRWEPLPSSDAG